MNPKYLISRKKKKVHERFLTLELNLNEIYRQKELRNVILDNSNIAQIKRLEVFQKSVSHTKRPQNNS